MATIVDRRAERYAFPVLVIGTDRMLSGWGGASGGASYAAWACRYSDAERVERWVRSRGDISRVRVVFERKGRTYRPGRGCAHFSVYPVDAGHPALQEAT